MDGKEFWAAIKQSANRVHGLPGWTQAGITLSNNFEGHGGCMISVENVLLWVKLGYITRREAGEVLCFRAGAAEVVEALQDKALTIRDSRDFRELPEKP